MSWYVFSFGGRYHLSILLCIVAKVLLDDLVGKLVDLDIFMILKTLDFVEASTFFHHCRHGFHLKFRYKLCKLESSMSSWVQLQGLRLTSGPASFSMLFSPSKTTWITWVSLQFSRLQIEDGWLRRVLSANLTCRREESRPVSPDKQPVISFPQYNFPLATSTLSSSTNVIVTHE